MELYLTIGISGSGKSHLFRENNFDQFSKILCLDDIRKELTGSPSDQSMNEEAVKLMYERLIAFAASDENVALCNTHLSIDIINATIEKIKDYVEDIYIYVLKDSYKLGLCKDRVMKDIQEGKDRSDVPMEDIESQYEKFLDTIDNLYKIKFNNTKIIFM